MAGLAQPEGARATMGEGVVAAKCFDDGSAGGSGVVDREGGVAAS